MLTFLIRKSPVIISTEALLSQGLARGWRGGRQRRECNGGEWAESQKGLAEASEELDQESIKWESNCRQMWHVKLGEI